MMFCANKTIAFGAFYVFNVLGRCVILCYARNYFVVGTPTYCFHLCYGTRKHEIGGSKGIPPQISFEHTSPYNSVGVAPTDSAFGDFAYDP